MDEPEPHDWWEGDWPPAKYPLREAATFSLFALAVLGAVIWVLWKWL